MIMHIMNKSAANLQQRYGSTYLHMLSLFSKDKNNEGKEVGAVRNAWGLVAHAAIVAVPLLKWNPIPVISLAYSDTRLSLLLLRTHGRPLISDLPVMRP